MQSKIERQVMGSVATIYAARSLVSATAVKLYALVASVWVLGALVWVARIEDNFNVAFHGGVNKLMAYLLAAVSHTTLAVQITLLVALVALVSLAADAIRSAASHRAAW